jgi:hypothetical protein
MVLHKGMHGTLGTVTSDYNIWHEKCTIESLRYYRDSIYHLVLYVVCVFACNLKSALVDSAYDSEGKGWCKGGEGE